MDNGRSATELPQGTASGELSDDRGFGFGEPEVSDRGVELVWGLAEDDLGGRIGQEPCGDLAGRGAVVGLGDEIGCPVGDAQVGNAVGAAELEAGLEVARGVAVAEQCPGFVEDLDALRSGTRHQLLEPPGGGDHHQRESLGVERHRRQVEYDARAVPAKRDRGTPVEHAAQGAGQELVEGVGDVARLGREVPAVRPEPFGHLISGVGDEVGDVGERRLDEWRGGELFDRSEHDGVLKLGEVAFEDGGDERGAHLGASEDLAVLGLVFGRGTGSERVDGGGAARAEPHGGETEVLSERRVLALRVGDGNPASGVAGPVDGGLAPQEALDEGGLAVAGFAEDPAVGVGDQPSGVCLEGVPAELASSGEEVEADVGAPVSERALDRERVDAGHVRGRAAVEVEAKRCPVHDASNVEGARPRGSDAAHAMSWRASRTRRSMPVSRASCSTTSACSSSSSWVRADTVTSPAYPISG